MRKGFIIYLNIVVLICCIFMVSCRNKAVEAPLADNDNDSTIVNTTYIMAINQYLSDVVGKQYSQGDVCIPCVMTVAVDESNADDILVWGDFWVFNYQIIGDLLKTVSGGSHPGLMHVRQTDDSFEVTGFDAVADGSGYIESAKKIFGDKYEDLNRITSDDDKRELIRKTIIAQYVSDHRLPVVKYQDYGWPAVTLPKK